jgi:hypothetical protein
MRLVFDEDADGHEVAGRRFQIPQGESLDPQVTLIVDRDEGVRIDRIKGQSGAVEDGFLSGIGLENDGTVDRIARDVDLDLFGVDPSAKEHGRSRRHGLGGVLDRAPRRGERAGIAVIPGRAHVKVGCREGEGEEAAQEPAEKEGGGFHGFKFTGFSSERKGGCSILAFGYL